MEFTRIGVLWPEKKGFEIDRTDVLGEFIFVHFLTPAQLLYEDKFIPVTPGGCIFFKSYGRRCFKAPSSDLIHNWFHVKGDVDKLLEAFGLEFEAVYYPINDDFITPIIQSIEFEMLLKNPYYQEICSAKCAELIAKISRGVKSQSKVYVDRDTRRFFEKIRSEIHMEYDKDWTVEKMAARANLSPSRFYTLYGQIFGVTPKKDLTDIRIAHAKQLLADKGLSVGETALLTGFTNQYHFIRQFKKVTGITPGKYSKRQEG
ncbi:MAG: AraC family transcriptional regulator [Bacillota bacterium]|nr:AraC family transcriptional regulator [Bacillota bacterium]